MPGVAPPAPGGVTPGTESENAGIVQAAAQKWGIPAYVLWGVYGTETGFGSDVNTSSTGAVGSFQFEPGTASTYGYPLTNSKDVKTFAAQADAAAHYLHDLYSQTGAWNQAISDYNSGPAGSYQAGYVSQVLANGKGISAVKITHNVWVAIAAALGITLPLGLAGVGLLDAIIPGIAADAGVADAGATDAADTAATTAKTAAKGAGAGSAGTYAAKDLSDLAKLAKTGGIAALLIDPHFLLRAVEIVGGMALLYFGFKQLASVAVSSV